MICTLVYGIAIVDAVLQQILSNNNMHLLPDRYIICNIHLFPIYENDMRMTDVVANRDLENLLIFHVQHAHTSYRL